MLGGTLPYMAPEQIEAFLNPDLWGTVGARADIYSLGLVLRELLTGQAPDVPDDKLPPARAMRELLDRRAIMPTDVRSQNPEIPHALEAIVQRCLMFDPEKRYPDSQALADDLECFLSRKPLRHAVNPSRRERVENWVARNHRSMVGIRPHRRTGHLDWLLLRRRRSRSICATAKTRTRVVLPSRRGRLALLDQKQSSGPSNLFGVWRREYPDHPLPSVLLGLGAVRRRTCISWRMTLRLLFEREWSLPDCETTIRDWVAQQALAIAMHRAFRKSRT